MTERPILRNHVKPPPSFNGADKTLKWKLWKSLFENYMIASNYVALTDAEKRAVLLANLHPSTYEIFMNLPNTGDQYTNAVDALDRYFGEKYSKVYAIYNFRKITQESGQDIQTFVSTLHAASKECGFGARLENEVKQQLISGIKDSRICQELLMLDEEATLEQCVTRAKTLESSVCDQANFSQTAVLQSAFPVRQAQERFASRTPRNCVYCGRGQQHSKR
jgi:hypothetical protein